jgi:3-dehydroquinate dehydratase type I
MREMNKARICAAIIDKDIEAIKSIEPVVDLFEVRIDIIGDGWQDIVRQIEKPWIACNRLVEEGGKWQDTEARRIEKLLEAIQLGADIIDIELRTKNLDKIVNTIKKRAECLISYHDMKETPSLDEMKGIVKRQLKAGADICKVVGTASTFADNLNVLKLISEYPEQRIVSFVMGTQGAVSRVLCPVTGGDFTYASINKGRESAPGQITVYELIQIYEMMGVA